jgi:hypothetical protein
MNLRRSKVRLGKVKVSEEIHKCYSNRWGVIRAQHVVGVKRMISKPTSELCVRKHQVKRLLRTANHSPPVARQYYKGCRSRWQRCLRLGTAVSRFLRLRVRIPPGAWMPVSCECFVLSGWGLSFGLITGPEESYRVWSWSLDNEGALAHWGAVAP